MIKLQSEMVCATISDSFVNCNYQSVIKNSKKLDKL